MSTQPQKKDLYQQQLENFLASAAPKKKGIGGHIGDTALSALSGAVSVPELAVGLADIPTGGRVGKFLENEGGSLGFRPGEAKAAIADAKTEGARKQLKNFTNTEGFSGKVGYALNNPSLIANTVVESLPSMLAGGVIGRGLGVAAKGLSPVAAGAIGEGAVGAGLAAEGIRQQTDDGLLTPTQAGLAAATGVTTAGFGYAGGRLAKKLGIGDFETIIAGGGRTANPAASVAGSAAANAAKNKNVFRRAGEGALTEGLLEELPQSVSETILQNQALGRPLDEGVSDAAALGLLSGMAMGAGSGVYAKNRAPVDDVTNAPGGMPQFRGPLSREDLQARIQGPAPQLVGPNQQPPLVGPNQQPPLVGPVAQGMPSRQPVIQGPAPELVGPNQPLPLIGPTQQPPLVGPITPPHLIGPSQQPDAVIPQAPKPSELMGLDANKGNLSSAAVVAVDTGAAAINSISPVPVTRRNVRPQAGSIEEQKRQLAEIQAGFKLNNPASDQADSATGLTDESPAVNVPELSSQSVTASEPALADVAGRNAWQQGVDEILANVSPSTKGYAELTNQLNVNPLSVSMRSNIVKQAKLMADNAVAPIVNRTTPIKDEVKATGKTYTADSDEIPYQWDVVDAKDLVSSHSDTFGKNPNFPQDAQPRDRANVGYQAQVLDIENRLKPEWLGESAIASDGSPIIGRADNVVESGNGRTIAIRKVYKSGKGEAYKQFVKDNAEKYGLDVDTVAGMSEPVLVRRNLSGMDRAEFAVKANDDNKAEMGNTELARIDAKLIPNTELIEFDGNGSMNLNASRKFVQQFTKALGVNQAAKLTDQNGNLSQTGQLRVTGALLHNAYGSDKLTRAVTETLDPLSKNILKTLADKAPQISKLKRSIEEGKSEATTLAEDITTAAERYIDLAESRTDIDLFLANNDLFNEDAISPEVSAIISDFNNNSRSAVKIGAAIQSRINAANNAGKTDLFSNTNSEVDTATPNVLSNEPAPTNGQAATQLTDENPTVNIPAPKKAPRELSDKAMVREMQKPTAKNTETDYKAALNLSEGQNLGRLIMSSGRVFDDAVVKNMDSKGVTVEATVNGKRGLHKGLQYQTVDAGINNTKSYANQQAARQEVSNNDNSSPNASEANETADSAGTSRAETGVSDRNAPQDADTRQKQARDGLDASSMDQEVSLPKTYAQVQTEVADEMGITTNEDGEYDISDAQFDVMEGRVRDRMEAQESQVQPQAPVAKPETALEAKKDELTPEQKTARRILSDKYRNNTRATNADLENRGLLNKLYEKAGVNSKEEFDKLRPFAQGQAYADLVESGVDSSVSDTKTKGVAWVPPKPRPMPAKLVPSGKTHPKEMLWGRNSYHKLIGENFYGQPVYQDNAKSGTRHIFDASGKATTVNDFDPTNDPGLASSKPGYHSVIDELNAINIKDTNTYNAQLRVAQERYDAENSQKPEPVKPVVTPKAEVVTPKTEPETKSKPATPTAVVAEIEDFGEKITGARKDMQSFYQKEITDDDIISQPLSKIWPKKDVDAIEDTQMAALATTLRSTIPSKPRKGYRLNSWVGKVKSTRGIMQNMLSGDMPANEFISQLTQVEAVADIGYQAQLLAQLDKEQWSRIESVDPRIGYRTMDDDGNETPFVGFAVKIDKRTHVFKTSKRDISEITDKVNELLAGTSNSQSKSSDLKFTIYGRGRGDNKSYFIAQNSDKDKTPLIEFNDLEEARVYKSDNNANLTELWDQHKERVNVKKSDMRSNANRERIGPDHRSGQDVTTEQFMNTFGLRGGQFGNWVKQGANSKDRQNMLNDAYDAFMDLAGVLNIPPEAIGLGGKLGMSFGARGKGSAMAHYEPSQVVINLTKTKGAGTLAHEWFHALDHHFTSFRDSSDRNKTREGTYITYKPEPSMMYTPQKGRGYLISKPALKKRQENSKDPMYAAENWAPDPSHPEGVRPKIEEAFADLVNSLNDSPMKDRATTIDKGAPDGYWSRIIERAARSFESYIIHKLEQQGARSDFLANVTPEDAFPRNMDRYPYLLESEMAPVAEAFDNLFATIDSKASEDGNGKTLFSRAGQLSQAIDKVKANAVGSTNTTRQQVIGKLNDKFGKQTIDKLMADGKLDIKVLSDFVKDGKLTIPSDVDGLYLNGKATLIADNLSDDMIIPTFLHELGGHGGMQSLMDKKAYNALMKDFDALVKAGDPLAMQAKAMADKVARNEQDALDEYLPYLITLASRQQAKQGKVAGMINRMVMAIRSWLKNTLGVPIQINAQDILSLAERMVNEVEKQGSLDNMANAAPQFSDPNIPDKQMQDVRDQYENTDSWMTAPNGKPTNLTENQWVQTRTPAFKQWFGDWQNDPENASKIVDDNGEPRITYHQTDDTWNTFDKSKAKAGKHDNETPTGIFVKGSDRDIGIGENLNQMPLFTNIKNPLELKDRQAAKKYYESNIDGYADIVASMKKDDDTYSKALDEAESSIQAELKRRYETGDRSQSSKELFKKSRDILNEWTASQQANSLAAKKLIDDHLAENDIDGVVLEVDEGSFGRETDAIIAINNNQIKSATDNAGTFNASNPDIRFSDPNVPAKQLDDVRDKYEGTDKWMKTPNGSDTNLTEQQWLQVRTPAFKEWFGNWEGSPETASKVVDTNGEPMVVYHGTGNDFNIFEKSKAVDKEGRQMMMGWGKDKFYFADNEMGAKVAASAAIYYGKGKNERVIPAFLNIRNPISAEDYSEQVGRPDTPRKRDNIINKLDQSLTNQGYDGIIDKESGGIASFNSNQIKSATDNIGTFDSNNNDIRYSRAAGMNDQFDPRNIAKETATRLYDWASSAPPGKLSWWHKTLGTMYNLSQRNPYFKPVYQSTEKFINDVSFYASKASEFAPRLLPQLDSIRDITKSAIGAKDNEALSKPIFEGTLLWGRDLDGKAVLIEDWRKKVMAASKQDRLQMLKDANRITPAQLQQLATLNNIQANRFINGIIDEEVNAGLVWTDAELRSKFNLDDKQIGLYKEFRATTDNSLDSMTRSDMLRRLGKDAAAIETAVMEAGTLREAVFNIEQHINSLIQASPKKEKSLKNTLKDIKESKFRTDKLIDDGYAPLSRFGQYTVDVVDSDGNREYFGMFESAYEARKMKAEMDALYGNDQDFTVTQGALSNEEFKLFAGVTPETAELFGEMMGLDATGDKAADDAFQEYLRRTKNNRSTMKRLMHRKGIKGYSEDVGRVLASFVYSNARHTSAALNMGNLDRSIQDIPKGEGQLKDAAVKLAEYIKNPQEEGNVIRGWMFAQYLGGSIASAAVNITQPLAVSFPYLSQFGGAVKAASQLRKSSADWTKALIDKSRDHFEADLLEAIERAEADGTLSPQEVHNLLRQASGKNPLSAGDGTKVGDAKALASNTLSRVSLAWGSLFSAAEQVNRRITFVAAYRLAVDQGMDNPAEFATNSIKETQFVYNKASRMNWGRGAVGGTLMTFKTYTVSYMELMNRLWTQGEKGSEERAQGRKAVGIMIGTLFLLGGAGGLPFMEDTEDLVDGIGQIMGYNFSSKKVRQDFLDEWVGEMMGDFIDGGISSVSGSPTDVSGRLGLGNLIPGTGIFKERTSNVRDILELAGPAGDFVGRIGTGSRDIAKGVANLDTTSLKKGALEFAPTAVRNAVKGVSMATTGMYKDTKGYKVADTTPIDAAFKAIGFQPRDISKIQEANYLGQSSTSYYNLRASNIRALWAAGVNEGNQSKVADARAAVKDWNAKNPTQKIVIKPNDIAKRVREMRMDKSERVIKKAPKSSRSALAEDFAKAGQ